MDSNIIILQRFISNLCWLPGRRRFVSFPHRSSHAPKHQAFQVALLFLISIHARAGEGEPVLIRDSQSLWKEALELRTNTAGNGPEMVKGVSMRVTARVKEDPSFLLFVRKMLREGQDASTRLYAGAVLNQALGKDSYDDCLFMLSDSEPAIRGLACGTILRYRMTNLAACLPSLLLRSDSSERYVGLKRIELFMKAQGLPYYTAMLNDNDPDVACKAAECLRICRKDDATPHLLSYLKKHAKDRKRKSVVSAVVLTIQDLHGEPLTEPADLRAAAKFWIERLQKEQETNKVLIPQSELRESKPEKLQGLELP
jgi:hypothetical protein